MLHLISFLVPKLNFLNPWITNNQGVQAKIWHIKNKKIHTEYINSSFFVQRGLKTKQLLKNTKNSTFTSTTENEKTFANNSKFKAKNSNTKDALKLKNSSNGIQENLENFQGYYLLIAVGIRVESRRAESFYRSSFGVVLIHFYFCSAIPCLITCVSSYLENDLKRSIWSPYTIIKEKGAFMNIKMNYQKHCLVISKNQRKTLSHKFQKGT